jgi:hypothetical protein
VPRHWDWQHRYFAHCIRRRDWGGLVQDTFDHSMSVLCRWGSRCKRLLGG